MLDDGKMMIFSRNSENLSGKYPDVIERMPKVCFFALLIKRPLKKEPALLFSTVKLLHGTLRKSVSFPFKS